uniref:Uncharacterized protein n=1 Tax=Arundo donax TaxID=35708 RepID=A0A0A8XYK7_ARUDO
MVPGSQNPGVNSSHHLTPGFEVFVFHKNPHLNNLLQIRHMTIYIRIWHSVLPNA